MPKRDVLIIIIAIVSGAFAFLLILGVMNGSSNSKMQFVVASQAIAKGQVIQINDLVLSRPMVQKNASSLFLKTQDVVGNTALEAIPKDALIDRSQVTPVRQEAPVVEQELSLPLLEGKRALTLTSKEVENVPDVLKAGNRVDIMGVAANYEGSREMQTIVSGVLVLSVEKKDGSEIKSFTVAMSPQAAVAVAKIMTNSKLTLAFRPDTGSEIVEELTMVGYTQIIRGVDKEKNVNADKITPQ